MSVYVKNFIIDLIVKTNWFIFYSRFQDFEKTGTHYVCNKRSNTINKCNTWQTVIYPHKV